MQQFLAEENYVFVKCVNIKIVFSVYHIYLM